MHAMDYVEHTPPADLQRHVQCAWVLHDEAPDDAIHVIYPDGRCELLAEFGTPLRLYGPDGALRADQPTCFAAQQRGPIRLQSPGPVHCIGVRLSPACSSLVVGAHLSTLRDTAIDLYQIDADLARGFRSAAQMYVEHRQPEPLWEWLRPHCAVFRMDPLAEQAVNKLEASAGDLRISDLASALGTSLRSLQTRFLHAVGMTPKEYARVCRLQALLHTLDNEHAEIAEAAARHGYSDQAHATRDLSRWTGITPARLMCALRENRNGVDTLRLAAAFLRGRCIAS